jgi:iron complex outermembrane recepter protein
MSIRIVLPLAFALMAHAASARAEEAPAPDTLGHVVPMPVIEVSTARTGERPTVAVTRLRRDAIRGLDWGQDTPMALASQPGAYAYSDAGNGVGYSYLTLRGFPQRRISVLVNGVPLNDPESHEVYWIDHPDLLSSTSELQIQRGVGPALYGAAALGGSVNVETAPFGDTPHATVTSGAGSFGTRRLVLEGDSGRLTGGWNLYGRYARVESDGYRENSWSRLWSYTLAARRLIGNQSFRVNLYGGPEETHLAYLGNSPDYMSGAVTGDADRDRRFNPLTYDGERDHFFEPHYEFIHTWAPSPALTLTQTLFWFDGRGYYDEHRTGAALSDYRLPGIATTDTTLYPRADYDQDANGVLIRDAQGRATVVRFDVTRRREVVNRHYGWLPRARWAHGGGALTVGGELRFHDGHHIGTVIAGDPLPPGTPNPSSYYDYHPRTVATGLYAREEWDLLPALRLTGDMAWRHAGYAMRGDRFDGIRFDQRYDFGAPRVALSWQPAKQWQAFASYAYASREPAFRDLYDAEGVGSVPLYRHINAAAGVFEDPLIRPEHVNDLELGGSWHAENASLSANAYRMDFRDELVFAGQFDTDLGYPILGNAARSVHQGIELGASASRRLQRGVELGFDGNTTLSDNHFVEFRESYGPTPADQVVYDGKPLGFVPAIMANAGARIAWHGVSARIEAQQTGRIFVDNTGTDANSIAPRTVWNGALAVSGRVAGTHASATLRGFNLGDLRYATSGYMDYDSHGALVPTVMPAATRSWLAEVRVEW